MRIRVFVATTLTLLLLFSSCVSTSGTTSKSSVGDTSSSSREVEKSKNGEYVAVKYKFENIDPSEASWLLSPIADKLEANLKNYTGYNFFNSTNIKEIFAIRAQSDSLAFDQESKIEESSPMKMADKTLFVTVRKDNEGYSLSAQFSDTSKGINLTPSVTNARKTSEALYSSVGGAVNELTIDLCDKLGYSISKDEQNFMMKGEEDLAKENVQAIYEKEIMMHKNAIAEIENEIAILNVDTDEKAKLEAENLKMKKEAAQKKLQLAEENKKRIAEEIRQKEEDDKKNQTRTAAQKERISSVNYTQKLAAMREQNYQKQSLYGKLKVIEMKKKAAVDIHNSLLKEKESILKNTLAKIEEDRNRIINAPYRTAELKDDKVTPAGFAIANRNKAFEKAKKNRVDAAFADFTTVANNLIMQQNILLSEIEREYKNLSSMKISSIDDNLTVSYGPYDGNRLGWVLYVTVKSDDSILTSTQSFISFEDITGKNPNKWMDEDYLGYLAEIDFYNGLFANGEPIFVFELEYEAEPLCVYSRSQLASDKEYSKSLYKFNFYNLKCYDSKSLSYSNGKLKSNNVISLNLEESSTEIQYYPAYDLAPLFEKISVDTIYDDVNKSLRDADYLRAGLVLTYEELPQKTDGSLGKSGKYILFGNWPQSVKDKDVTITESKVVINGWECYKGSDDAYYTEAVNNTQKEYYFSNFITPVQNEKYYFKMEPIKWRVLDDLNGSYYVLAEDILTVMPFMESGYGGYSGYHSGYNSSNNYEYSSIRAYLNGLDGSNYDVADYRGKGFIDMAFTPEQRDMIKLTTYDNSPESTTDATGYRTKSNLQVSNTTDKITLISQYAVSLKEYGFPSSVGMGSKGKKKTFVDYAKTLNPHEDYPNSWWYRSASGEGRGVVSYCSDLGWDNIAYPNCRFGVVPCLVVKY